MANGEFIKAGENIKETKVKSAQVLEATDQKEQTKKMQDLTEMFSSIYENIQDTRDKYTDKEFVNQLTELDSSFEDYIDNVINMENKLAKFMDENQEMSKEEVEELQKMMETDKQYIKDFNEKRESDKKFNKELKKIEEDSNTKIRQSSSIAKETLEYQQEHDVSKSEMWESINNNIKELSTTYVQRMEQLGGELIEGIGGPYAKLAKQAILPVFNFLKDSPIFQNIGQALGFDKIKNIFGGGEEEEDDFDKQVQGSLEEIKNNTEPGEGTEGEEEDISRQDIKKRRLKESRVRVKGDEYDQREQLNDISQKQVHTLDQIVDTLSTQNQAFRDIKENTSMLEGVRDQIVNMSDEEQDQNEDHIRALNILQEKFREISDEERDALLESDEKMQSFIKENLDESALENSKQTESLKDIVGTMEKQEGVWAEEEVWRKKQNEFYENMNKNMGEMAEGVEEDDPTMNIATLIMGLLPLIASGIIALVKKIDNFSIFGDDNIFSDESKKDTEDTMAAAIENAKRASENFEEGSERQKSVEDLKEEMQGLRTEYVKAKEAGNEEKASNLRKKFESVYGKFGDERTIQERLKTGAGKILESETKRLKNMLDPFGWLDKESESDKGKEDFKKEIDEAERRREEQQRKSVEETAKQTANEVKKESSNVNQTAQINTGNIEKPRINVLYLDTNPMGSNMKITANYRVKS